MAIFMAWTSYLPYIIIALAVIVIITIYIITRSKKQQSIPDDTYFNDIIAALGQIDNIGQVSKEHRRVQIELKAVDKVDTKQLKSLALSAFLTGKKITLLMNEQGSRLLDHIKRLRKEER